MSPLAMLDAGAARPCRVGVVDGLVDAGPKYVLRVQYGAFQSVVGVPDEMFGGQPFFGYGLATLQPSGPVTLHVDNAACWVGSDGGAP